MNQVSVSCAEALAQGKPTDAYVKYVMRWAWVAFWGKGWVDILLLHNIDEWNNLLMVRWVDMLLHHNIKPVLVFDGRNLPSKAPTEKKRKAKRFEQNRFFAWQDFLSLPNRKENTHIGSVLGADCVRAALRSFTCHRVMHIIPLEGERE